MWYKAKWADFLTMRNAVPQPAGASELHMCNVALPTPTHKHKHTYGLLIFNSPSNLQYAQMHRSTKAQTDCYIHKHIAPKWAPLTDRGEGGAVMQRQGPYTGLHAHCLGIITSNSYAQWFWQAQGWATTAWCGQEWLCWTMTTQWLLLCTSDSHHTNNSQIHADNQGGSSCETTETTDRNQWKCSLSFTWLLHKWVFMMCSHFNPLFDIFENVVFTPWN